MPEDDFANAELSAVYSAAKALVGQVNSYDVGPLSGRDFERFASAVRRFQPWTTDSANDISKHCSSFAPPMFLTSTMEWEKGSHGAALGFDGASRRLIAGLPVDGLRLMGAGQEIEFKSLPKAGAVVSITSTFEGVEIKSGRSGQFLAFAIFSTYDSSDKGLLLTCRETFVVR